MGFPAPLISTTTTACPSPLPFSFSFSVNTVKAGCACRPVKCVLHALPSYSVCLALRKGCLLPKVRSCPPAVKPSSQIPHLDIPPGLFIPLRSPVLCFSEGDTWQGSMGALSPLPAPQRSVTHSLAPPGSAGGGLQSFSCSLSHMPLSIVLSLHLR